MGKCNALSALTGGLAFAALLASAPVIASALETPMGGLSLS